MARIYFYGLPVSGHMHPALGVVQELVRRGHEVHAYATRPWAERIEAVGGTPRVYDDPYAAASREVGAELRSSGGASRAAVVVEGVLGL